MLAYNLRVAFSIGFDARAAFLDPRRGFGRVARCLAGALLEAAPNRIVLFVPHGVTIPTAWYPLAREVVQLRRPRRAAFLCDPFAWSLTLRRHPVEVLYLPAWGVPFAVPAPVVATFHDATPFLFRSPPAAWPRWRARRAIRSLHRAALVHAVSYHAASQLESVVPEASGRVAVAHWGVGPPFLPAPHPITPRHILYVGGGDPHKNLTVVLRMLEDPKSVSLPPLVLAGQAGHDPRVLGELRERGLAARTTLEPAVTDDALAELYRGALAAVLPSPHEGFGLPALEAMACGCPVVAARGGALPETCGDAAMLVDPVDPQAWCSTLVALRSDPERGRALRAAGLARAGAMTWRKTAELVLGLCAKAISGDRETLEPTS